MTIETNILAADLIEAVINLADFPVLGQETNSLEQVEEMIIDFMHGTEDEAILEALEANLLGLGFVSEDCWDSASAWSR